MSQTDNQDMPLPTVADLRRALPASAAHARSVRDVRRQVQRICAGEDDRMLVVAGPCSVHDPRAVFEVAEQLQTLAERHAGELLVLVRAYFEKARTHVGWKGYLSDPHLDGGCDMASGLRGARELLLRLAGRGIGIASELLDPHAAGYFSDLLSWAAIGARTSESQPHRELASGLPLPVGFKNGTDGRVANALWAVRTAAAPHSHLCMGEDGRPVARRTAGNPYAHLVLRGGDHGPNYSAAHVAEVLRAQVDQDVSCPILIDCSHQNSGKRPERQPEVLADVAAQVALGQRAIVGVMLESHLVSGRQDLVSGRPLTYGQSITDACIDMATAADCLAQIAAAVRTRRSMQLRAQAGEGRIAPHAFRLEQ